MKTGIQIIGDWKKDVGVLLHDLLQVLTEVTGRSGFEACKYAIIGMAQTMRAMTKKAPARRPVEINPSILHGSNKFIRVFHKGRESKVYEWLFSRSARAAGTALEGTWAQAQRIKNRGLASRSWMWGLRDLQAMATASMHPIPGVADVRTILGDKSCGLVLTDRLSYLTKILPAGWQEMAVRLAGNKIMANVARKMEQRWLAEIRRARRSGVRMGITLAQAFRSAT